MWVLDHSHGVFNPCTCTDELSCLTFWSLKSRNRWQVANWYKNAFSRRYDIKNTNLPIYFSNYAGAVTISLSESDVYMVLSWRDDMYGHKIMGSSGFTFSIDDESGAVAGARPAIPVSDSGFPEPNLIWMIPGRDVPCGICDILGTISSDSLSSPTVVGAGAASVRNGSNPLEQFRVRVGTGTELLQRVLPHKNSDCCIWLGFTTNNPAYEPHNFSSNWEFEFWLYRDMMNM